MAIKYLVSWVKYNRDSPKWREIKKFQRCSSLVKANRLKANLQKQLDKFSQVTISEIL